MHGMEDQQGASVLATDKHRSNGGAYKSGGSKEMMSHYTAACAAAATAGMVLASPRGAAQQQCKYKSGKCANPRATKRNGQLHTLCHFHRVRQNEHQRKSDRKHRMVSVARRAKLGNMGLLVTSHSRTRSRNSISSNASDISSDAPPSTPASPMDVDRSYEHQADGAYLSAYHLQNHSRVQHHHYLTQPGKLDSFRATSTPGGLTLPPPSSFMSGTNALNSQAGKMA